MEGNVDLGLKDKTALVTAASKGLGKAAALALAREGARVVLCARSERAQAAADEIRAATGARVLALQGDLTNADDVDRIVHQALEHMGHLDILILNAGGPPPGTFLDLRPLDWESAIQLTLMSTVRLCYAALPHMVARGQGSLVATQSFTIKQPLDNLVLSNALRMAVIGLVKSLANELGPKGIRVNSINPGWTLTERVDQLMKDRAARSGTTAAEEASRITREIPLGRLGSPEEYGRAVAWLASPAAAFIHGHALIFDGGAVRAAL
jgi:3-oxoacyl-[acyl-carrier protein] reductase